MESAHDCTPREGSCDLIVFASIASEAASSACGVGALSPDETALHIPAHRALAIGDGVVRWEGVEGLTFVPDFLMDEPEKTRDGLRAAYRRLLDELEFDHLLLAHGDPVVGDAEQQLRALVGD